MGNIFAVNFAGISNVSKLMERISDNFPHKKITDSIVFLYVEKSDETAKTILIKIIEKNQDGIIYVCPLENFFGLLPNEVWDWITEKGIKVSELSQNLNK